MDVVVASAAMLAVDSIYLTLLGKPRFSQVVSRIQGRPMVISVLGAILAYAALIFVFYWFIIRSEEERTVLDAFILGVCIYAVYDGTTRALFNKYDWGTAIVDTVWGGTLFSIVFLVWSQFKHLHS
jgi:uncharacterized membrane protein